MGITLMDVQRGYDAWAAKPHNAKWVRKIDGTPIANDIVVNVFDEIKGLSALHSTQEGIMTDIVKTLRHLVSLNETENGGPFLGFAARACVSSMKEAADLIESLRSRAEKAEEEHQQSSREWRDAFDAMHQRATLAEATCEKLAAALQQIIDMNVQYAIDRWGDANQAEPMACVRTARRALTEYRKEASE